MEKRFQKLMSGCLLIAVIVIASCSKTNGTKKMTNELSTTYSIDKWIGNYSYGKGPVAYNITAELKSDNTAIITKGNVVAYGQWVKTANVLKVDFAFGESSTSKYSLECITSANGKTMEGTWGKTTPAKDKGVIVMTKL